MRGDSGPNQNNLYGTLQDKFGNESKTFWFRFQNDIGTFLLSFLTLLACTGIYHFSFHIVALVFCNVQVCPTVPVFTLDESKPPKRKNLLSESEEPEGTESIRFTSRGLDQELIRQVDLWARIFKCLWSPGIKSKEWIPPAYVAWRAGTITLFLLDS